MHIEKYITKRLKGDYKKTTSVLSTGVGRNDSQKPLWGLDHKTIGMLNGLVAVA